MSKQNDYFLNQLYNPEFSPGDFQSIGLNSENTSIENKNDYKNLDIVRDNPLLQTDGKFDENKFNRLYDQALVGYNLMSNSASNEKLATSYSAFRDDIFAKSAKRTNQSETFITKMPNPNRQQIGFVSNNIMENPSQSVREIAQNQLVWDGETNSWIDSPNNTWFDNFINPKVLAQYDEDIDINGKSSSEFGFDKEHIAHKKGEKKINPLTGTYYYETLNGRDIYGRDVLSGWDTLTKDGSWINQYDFFDSDDLQKSSTGSLMKSVVKVAPALIPTIAPWYIGARVLLNSADLFAKVGKMIPGIGSESPMLSYLEGLNAAATQSTSDQSRGSQEMGMQAHAWSMENLLNLSADVFTQLAEQRWMFTHLPSLLKGNKLGFSKEAQEKFKKETADKLLNQYKGLNDTELVNPIEKAIDLKTSSMLEAQSLLESKLDSANKFGEHISKLYMTGITVADSYEEAKDSGLSDTEAAIFTLAYAAGEYGILSTNLGEHILPELRAEKHKYRNIERVLREGQKNTSEEVKKDPRKWYQRLMGFAKEAVVGDYNDAKIAAAYTSNSTAKAIATSVASNALGEGLEEVSEELWFDIAKGLQNAATELGLTQTGTKLETFDGWNLEQTLNRYALNFVGGLAGGAIAVGLPGFQQGIKDMLGTNMTQKEAYQQLVALIRNGKKDDFLRTIDKLETADSNLSATEYETIDGRQVPKLGTSDNNQDKANKTVLKGMVDLIDNLLTVNKVKMDDKSILSKLTEAPALVRFQTLIGGDEVGSATLANYLQRFNSLSTKITDIGLKIEAIKHPKSDQKGEQQAELQQNAENLSQLEAEMKSLIEERNAYLNGDMAKIIIPKVIFEMSPLLSAPFIQTNFKDYAEKLEGKVLANIPESRIEELEKSWKNYKNSNFKDDIEFAFQNFMLITEKFSEGLKAFNLSYLKNPNDYQQNLGNLFSQTQNIIMSPDNEAEDIQKSTQSFEQTAGISKMTTLQKNMQALHSLMKTAGLDVSDISIMMNTEGIESLEELLPGDKINIKRIADSIGESFDENSFSEKDINRIKDKLLKKKIYETLVENSDKVKEVLNNIRYFNQSTRQYLKDSFLKLVYEYDKDGDYFNDPDLYDETDPDYQEELNKRTELYKEYSAIIDSKPTTPIEQLADQFQLALGDNNHIKISDLITTLQNQMSLKANLGVIEEFGYGADIQEQIKNALQVLDVLASNILGARSDGGKLGAIFGFNSTVNQLNPDMKLAEIEKDSANTLMQDLAKLRTQLEYFKTIFDVNSGQKLEEQKKIHNRVNYSFIKKMKTIVQALPPDDWNEKDESGIGVLDKLLASLNKATTFESIDSSTEDVRFNLDSEKAKKLEKESIEIQDALYDFFQANMSKLQEGKLDLSMLKIIPSTSAFSKDYEGTLIDSNIEQFDDRSAIMLIATAAAVKASDFYAEYKNSLVNGIAPIPGQELATRMAYSFLLNKPIFQLFGKAYNDRLLEELEGVDSGKQWTMYGKNISPNGKLDNSYALQFLNTFLVEGIPGAGKTQGFQRVLYNMLNQYHKELLDEVWFIHTDENKAKSWAEKLGADPNKSKFFSKKTYLETIYPGYTPAKTNENGVIITNKDELQEDGETGIWHFKNVELSKSVKAPSLILMDESTRFSQQEMLVSEAFQQEHDISAIATGDYDQIGAVGQFEIGENVKNFLNTSADNFFHSPKLGSSMRTENTIKDQNIAIARKNKLATIQKLASNQLTDPLIKLSYYQDNSGLYGERIIGKDSADLDEAITLMFATLKGEKDSDGNWKGEKITVIYQDKNSDIYKKLQKIATENENYKGKINFVESSAAQGDEGQYYIVDLKPVDVGLESQANMGNHANFVNTFYTAISRSSQGTLIIENPNIKQIAETNRVKELVKSPLSEEAKAKFSKNRIDVLSEIITSEPGKTPKVVRKTTSNSEEQSQNNEETGEEGTSTSEEEATELNKKVVNIKNDDPDEYNMLLHSMPVNETGFIQNNNGKLIPSVGYEERIDGLNGLTKLAQMKNSKGDPISRFANRWILNSDGTLSHQEEALDTLNDLAQIGLYTRDINEVKKLVKETLGLNLDDSEFGVDFLFMIRDNNADETHANAKKSGGFLRFIMSPIETIIGVFRGEHTPENANKVNNNNKEFALNIYRVVDGKRVNILTKPLCIFTNPLTMLNTEGFEDLKKEYNKIRNKHNAPKEFLNMLLTDPNLRKLPNAEKLIKHLQIYTYRSTNGDVVVYLDKTLQELTTSTTGPTITVSNQKGAQYFHTPEWTYGGEYTDLQDIDQSVHHLTQDIYYSKQDIVINGKTIVKKGHGFVLCSDFYSNKSDEELFQLFVDNELNDSPDGKISVIYVSSPKISISDYFKNFALKYKGHNKNDGDPGIDSNIGNQLSEFRIAEFITKNDSVYDQYLKGLINSNPTNKTLTLVKWDIFKSVIQQISQDFESLSGEEKVKLLEKDIKDTPYLKLIKYDGTDAATKKIIDNLRNNIYGDGKHNLKSFIANTLLNFVLKQKNGFIDAKLHWNSDGSLEITDDINNNINKVIESLDDKFKEGIFTQIKKSEDSEEALELEDYTFIKADSTNYENQYGKFRINGKIDSTMLVMDVSSIMDFILDTINNSTKKAMQQDWYRLDNRKHVDDSEDPTKVEDIISKELLDQFTNRSELSALILNNIKKFENLNDGNILKDTDLADLIIPLNELGYAIVGGYTLQPNTITLVKIPNGYTQSIEDDYVFSDYDIIQDSAGKYYELNQDGSVSEITEDFFNNFKEDVINEIKENASKDLSTLTDPEDILLAKIWQQVQSKSKGEGSAQTIDNILNMVDDESLQEIFTDSDLQMTTELGPVSKEDFKTDIQYYIQNKYIIKEGKRKRNPDIPDTFQELYDNINEELLDTLMTAINEAADNYTGC